MGGFHRRVLRDLGYDVTTVDPDPAAGADCARVPLGPFDVVCLAVPIAHLAEEAFRWVGFEGQLLIEKPGAASLADARYLANLMRGQRVCIGYVERFNPTVRRLRELLGEESPSHAVMTRWNDRPSDNLLLDVTSHDIDLARFLRLGCPTSFDARAGHPVRRRAIALTVGERRLTVDLTAHDTSPLHAQWHAFLANRPALGYAQWPDALRVHEHIELGALMAAA